MFEFWFFHQDRRFSRMPPNQLSLASLRKLQALPPDLEQINADDRSDRLVALQILRIPVMTKRLFSDLSPDASLLPRLPLRSLVRLCAVNWPSLGDGPSLCFTGCDEKDLDTAERFPVAKRPNLLHQVALENPVRIRRQL